MRRLFLPFLLAVVVFSQCPGAWAEPVFVNGLVFPGNTLDATRQPGANAGRLGFFSDIYYDPNRDEWWAVSDRGPGGGVLDYATRVQRFTLDVDPVTGRISNFRVKETIKFTDPKGLLSAPTNPGVASPKALNGLNPGVLNGAVGTLGRSFDPEGLAIHPRTGHLIVADEYGPSVYEFSRKGKLLRVFQTPGNLIPKVNGTVNYVADRDGGANAGRQDNRGFEGLAITPDGSKLYAVLQDPLISEPTPNNGRNGRNLRIVVFDNDRHSPTYGTSIAQLAYQLELQADIAARIVAAGGTATPTDPRQGRNIGLSAIVAINEHEFLVIERDNRGIGVDDPAGANVVGSKRVFKIDVRGATDITNTALPDNGDLTAAQITPVTKSPEVFIDLAANTLLPNGKLVEKVGRPHDRAAPEERWPPDPGRQRQRLFGDPGSRHQRAVRRLRRLQRRQRAARSRSADHVERPGRWPCPRGLLAAARCTTRLSGLAGGFARLREAGASRAASRRRR
ncbi:MAG TPA: esterase-like activity of phytase family protein [Methylomirabilota bacterium]|nr:esterase-like activity of phytase family protein [Methylomirabilota bacterium]